MKIYAQLNENNICVGISQLNGEVNAENMVEIGSFDESYVWKKYENGEWLKESNQPQTQPAPRQPTNTEVAQMISDMYADLVIAGVIE